MRNGKKIALAAMCVLVLYLLVSSAVAMAVEIEFMTWARPSEFEILRKLIAQWNKANPDIQVKMIETGWEMHHQQLDIRIAGGDAPDLFRTTPQFIRKYVERGHALELSRYFDEQYMRQFFPITKDWAYYKGKPYAIPMEGNTSNIIYNVDYFKQIGVQAPQDVDDAWTWSEWEDVGRKLKAGTKATYGFTGSLAKSMGDPHFLHSFGGSFLTPDLKAPNVKTEAVIEGLKMYKGWYDEKLEPISALFSKPDSAHDLFAAGRTGMYDWGVWMLDYLSDKSGGSFKIDVTFLPKGPFGYSGIPGGQLYVISSATKYPAQTAKFTKWINEFEQMSQLAQTGLMPANMSLAGKMVWKNWNVQMKKAARSFLYLMPIVYQEARHVKYGSMQQVYKENIGPAMLGKISVEEAVNRLDKAIRDLL